MEPDVVFERHRRRLFGVAYRIVGNAQDAEDLVQEAALRWLATDAGRVRAPEAWLVTTTSRLAVDSLRRASTERRAFTAAWPDDSRMSLQQPPGSPEAPGPKLADACRALLERLAPDERIAFVLRDVFDVTYGEVARTLGKSEAACRQMVRRARERVRAMRLTGPPASTAPDALVGRCVDALSTGERGDLLTILAVAAQRDLAQRSALPAARRRRAEEGEPWLAPRLQPGRPALALSGGVQTDAAGSVG